MVTLAEDKQTSMERSQTPTGGILLARIGKQRSKDGETDWATN